MKTPEPTLEYFLTRPGKQQILMVSFLGVISDSTANELKRCQTEVLSKEHTGIVILSFHGTVTVEESGIPHLIQIQKEIRANRKDLYLCSVNPAFKKQLTEQGAVRKGEMVDSLADVVRTLETGRKH